MSNNIKYIHVIMIDWLRFALRLVTIYRMEYGATSFVFNFFFAKNEHITFLSKILKKKDSMIFDAYQKCL